MQNGGQKGARQGADGIPYPEVYDRFEDLGVFIWWCPRKVSIARENFMGTFAFIGTAKVVWSIPNIFESASTTLGIRL